MSESSYLTLKELADYSRLSESTLRKLIRSGELPATHLSRKLIVKRSDFDWWAQRKQRVRHDDIDPLARKIYEETLGTL